MITLYHGSNVRITEVDLSKSRKGKDFGRGFYLNANKEQAMSMAERTTRIIGKGEPVLSAFEFDLDKAIADGLNILVFDDYSEEWADFVVMNRKNRGEKPVHDYDVVIGPIADNTVGVQIRRFVMGFMSVTALVEELKYNGDKAVQYFFGTMNALKYLIPKKHEP